MSDGRHDPPIVPRGAPLIRSGVRRLFSLALLRRRPAVLDAEVDEEIRLHLELRAEQLARRHGLSAGDARAEAERLFGSLPEAHRRLHDSAERREDRMRMTERLDSLRQDLRYAWRGLRRGPAFATIVVGTLALAIGLTTSVFSVVSAALLRPLPYPDPSRLVYVADQQDDETPMSYPELLEWRGESRAFSDLAAYFTASYTLTGDGEPEVLNGARVSASLPRLLGVSPALGRTFRPEEDARGAERVVMLSDGFWRRRFAASPTVIGRTLTLNGLPYTVVGVLSPGPATTLPTDLASARRLDYWVPFRLDATAAPRGLHFLTVVGRLAPGVTLDQARARLDAVGTQLKRDDATRHGARIGSLSERLVRDARPLLRLLLAAVGAVLLIACANVANLLLGRGTARQHELAIRGALGAGRARIVRQLVIESLVLAVTGGALGVAVAYGSLMALRMLAPANLPRVDQAGVDAPVLLFALAVSVGTGLLFGVLPALRASRPALGLVLRAGGRGTTGAPRERARSALVVTEVALSFVLLAAAGLLLQSFDRLISVDKGFDATRVLAFDIELPQGRYPVGARQHEFFRQALERVRALPGVEAAAVVNELPLAGAGTNGGFGIIGRPFPPEAMPVANKRVAGVGFFRVLRVPVLAGRAFDARDVAGAPQVAVVNAAFARRYFPGGSPVGRRLEFNWDTEGAQEIVGVVGDVRDEALDAPPAPTIYVPFGQRTGDPAMTVVVRTAGDPLSMVPSARAAMFAIDASQPIAQVRTLEEVVARSAAGRRVALSLIGAFAALALLLAAVGLFAVISYSVARRQQEIGVRRALGAQLGDVVGLVVRQGAVLVVVGAALGTIAAVGTGRLLAGLLFGVEPGDPVTLIGVALLLVLVAAVAMVVPVMRAARVDPLTALRNE